MLKHLILSTALFPDQIYAGCSGGGGYSSTPPVIPPEYYELNNMIYPWFLPDWWPYDLKMHYGYSATGILHQYTRTKEGDKVVLREETTWYAEVKVDAKMNRSKVTLWGEKERRTKLKEIVVDSRKNKRMVVEPVKGEKRRK